MKPFNKFLMLLVITAQIGGIPSVAISAGKMDNVTEEEVRVAPKESIKAVENTLDTLQKGEDETIVSEHINDARQ